MVEQSLADLVRVSDGLGDAQADPRVAALGTRIRSQLMSLQEAHDARVTFFFNEPPAAIADMPPVRGFPLPKPQAQAPAPSSPEVVGGSTHLLPSPDSSASRRERLLAGERRSYHHHRHAVA
jgi:hypothetical protein